MHVEDHDPLQRLQEAAKQRRHTPAWTRVQAIVLARQGDPAPRIARSLGCSRRAVQLWVAAYNGGGLAALDDRPRPGRAPILPRHEEGRFLERIDAPPRPEDGVGTLRGADIRRIPEQEFGARYSLDGVYKLLHRLDYNDLMPRPQHEDADEELQAIFREVVVDQIQAIEEAHPGQEVQVWHHDEARFGQQGTIARVWARRGSRPRRVRQNGRESLYVLTAVCALTGAAFGLILPALNTAVINQFLEEFARHLAPGVHAVLLWDNAGYHVSKGLVVPENVSLIGLLPYSPELNPVENLWHYLRAHYWSNAVYPDYDALLEAAMETWRKVCLHPEKVRSICAAPYLEKRK
jgi:transposase